MGNKDAVGTVISYSLPLLALVMYCLCNCSGYCRDLFTNCDIHILKKDNTGEGLAGNFIFCLYNILKINAVPIITLAAAYFILGCICQVYVITAQIIICIVFMGLFFSIFGLFTYYMFQPYNTDGTVRSFRYYMPSLFDVCTLLWMYFCKGRQYYICCCVRDPDFGYGYNVIKSCL